MSPRKDRSIRGSTEHSSNSDDDNSDITSHSSFKTKRANQLRIAQKAFRERRKAKVNEMDAKISQLSQALESEKQKSQEYLDRIAELEIRNQELEAECGKLKDLVLAANVPPLPPPPTQSGIFQSWMYPPAAEGLWNLPNSNLSLHRDFSSSMPQQQQQFGHVELTNFRMTLQSIDSIRNNPCVHQLEALFVTAQSNFSHDTMRRHVIAMLHMIVKLYDACSEVEVDYQRFLEALLNLYDSNSIQMVALYDSALMPRLKTSVKTNEELMENSSSVVTPLRVGLQSIPALLGHGPLIIELESAFIQCTRVTSSTTGESKDELLMNLLRVSRSIMARCTGRLERFQILRLLTSSVQQYQSQFEILFLFHSYA